ncbi:MAG: hypothetical protein U0939_09075 [Pirellulales bacterium]
MKRALGICGCLVALALATGCGTDRGPAAVVKSQGGDDDHDHAHDEGTAAHGEGYEHGAGPHGGAIVDWGGGAYHLEFTVDHERREAVVYLFGRDEKTPSPIKAASIQLALNDPNVELELAASPLDSESDGKSSRFVGVHDSFAKKTTRAGTLSGLIEGTPYTGDFQEEAHAD